MDPILALLVGGAAVFFWLRGRGPEAGAGNGSQTPAGGTRTPATGGFLTGSGGDRAPVGSGSSPGPTNPIINNPASRTGVTTTPTATVIPTPDPTLVNADRLALSQSPGWDAADAAAITLARTNGVSYDRIVMMKTPTQSQDDLAAAFRAMVAMNLPWFSRDFSMDHARMVAARFPQYKIYFDGTAVN